MLRELFETETIPYSFWLNVKNHIFIKSAGEHIDQISDNPKLFGLSPEHLQDLRNAHMGYGRDFWIALVTEVGKNGWVRGGKDFQRDCKSSYFLQGYNNKILRRAAKILADHTYYDCLLIDTFIETFNTSSFIKLAGKEIDLWIKTGQLS